MSLDYTIQDQNDSVFLSALPYGLASLGASAGGTYLAVSCYAAGSTALVITGVALAVLGSSCFAATCITAIYSKNSRIFHQNIGPALKSACALVLADLISSTARIVLIRTIDNLLNKK